MAEHAVIISFVDYDKRFFTETSRDLSPLFALEDEIEARVSQAGTGHLDGHEIAIDGKDGTIYIYGPDARALYDSIRPVIEASPITRGGMAFLYFGDVTKDDTKVEEIEIPGQLS